MKLTPEQKAQRHRQRLIDNCRTVRLGTYTRKVVAPLFQLMIRAEAGASRSPSSPAMFEGELEQVSRNIGYCVCVTCGKVTSWKGGVDRYSGMHTGHFLSSRRNSIVFEEGNVAPQCSHCNYQLGGNPQAFRKWMLAVRGEDVIQRLERLKNTVVEFTREQLVDMRISYAARLKAAEERMLTPASEVG